MTHIDGVAQGIQLVTSLLILLVIYFRVLASSGSFNHFIVFRILLDTKVNNGTSIYSKIPSFK